MSTTTATAGGVNELKRNALGLPSAMVMSIAFISPTIGVIFISALICGQAGISSPFAFILGTLGVALMGWTLAEFAKRVTSAGGFYKFVTLAFGSQVGFILGVLLLFAYVLQSPLNINLFGAFVSNALQTDFGIVIPWWILMIGVVALVGILGWYSVHTSLKFSIAFVIAEVTVVAILLLLMIFKGGDSGQIPAAFTPSGSPTGFGGIGKAFVFIIFAFFGFESCLTVAEEVKNPRRNLPIALIGSVALTGAWFAFAMYAVVVGYGASHMDALAAASAPVHDLAVRYIGNWYSNLVDLAAISAIIAVLLAIHTANFRLLYALGRDGLLPRALGRTHDIHKTPHIAIIVYSIGTLIVGGIAGVAWGPMSAFGNIGYLSSLGMLPVFIMTNLALIVFMRRQYPNEFSPILHGLFPIASILIFVAAIWLSIDPWPAAPLNTFPFIVLAVIVLAVFWSMVLKSSNSPVLKRLGDVLFMDGGQKP